MRIIQQLVQNNAQRPHIALASGTLLVINQLRTHVQRSADLRDLRVLFDVLHDPREPEIGDLYFVVVDQDVRGFQVSVDYVVLVQRHECFYDLG